MTEFLTIDSSFEAYFKYFILGLIQGLTEFLPISSTAHLKVVPILFGWEDPGITATAIIQLGSIFAVITYFRKDLNEILKGVNVAFRRKQWKEQHLQLALAITIGTLPILLGVLSIKVFWNNYEDSLFRSIPAIALISILMASILAIAEKSGKRFRSIKNISIKQGLFIGIGQMLSLFPGVSRSGITLSAALISGWKRQDAARFSFLLGIPAISIAGLVELKEAMNQNINIELMPLIIGIISATIMSWISIEWLLKYLQSNNTFIFIFYRLFFGVALLLWWLDIP